MKKYLKIYISSLLISMVVIFLPWTLGKIGVISLINVLSLYAPISAVIAVILSPIYVIKKTSSFKPRIVMFFLNPALYYLIILSLILLAFYWDNWNGFERLIT